MLVQNLGRASRDAISIPNSALDQCASKNSFDGQKRQHKAKPDEDQPKLTESQDKWGHLRGSGPAELTELREKPLLMIRGVVCV